MPSSYESSHMTQLVLIERSLDEDGYTGSESADAASLCPDPLTRLSAVEDRLERGPCKKSRAGGRIVAKRVASRSGTRQRARAAPAGLEIAFKVDPGRSMTTIGARSAIARQCRQRWNWRRLSAPMIQTKWTPGARRLSQRNVS